jgi:hypothetical protein
MRKQFGILYPRCVSDNLNVDRGSRSLIQSLAISINEKRDMDVKLRSEILEIQREMKEEKISLSEFDYNFNDIRRRSRIACKYLKVM